MHNYNHAWCRPEEHDTSLPDHWWLIPQAATPDGHIACNDCHAPMMWCRNYEDWDHVSEDAVCWLINVNMALTGWQRHQAIVILTRRRILELSRARNAQEET